MSNRVVVGIPARMESSRFFGKPLCKIAGLPMIEHVYKRCKLSSCVDDIFVATCNDEIMDAVQGFGGKAVMTDKEVPRPALRVAEACRQIEIDPDDIIVVVQGDEPLVHPKMIDLAIQPLLDSDDVFCVNLIGDLEEDHIHDPNEIKVVTDLKLNAIYMSRAGIPSSFHQESTQKRSWFRQVCIMPFRLKNLFKFLDLEPTPLEIAESVEMLRAIEHGYTVRMVHSPHVSKSVDTEKDRGQVEKLLENDPIWPQYK